MLKLSYSSSSNTICAIFALTWLFNKIKLGFSAGIVLLTSFKVPRKYKRTVSPGSIDFVYGFFTLIGKRYTGCNNVMSSVSSVFTITVKLSLSNVSGILNV